MRKWLLSQVLAVATLVVPCVLWAEGYSNHPLAVAFMDKMVSTHGFARAELQALLSQAERKESILNAMSRPAERVKPWYEYRQIFIQESRIDLGAEFWRANRDALDNVEKQYGVDAAIIVAIIGVETLYGRNTGSYRVIDALTTLAFDYPKRSPFFTQELENFLLLTREQRQDPLSLTGSYAGAMGYGQFMPSSYRNFAADYDGDGFNDIWDSAEDAIASVANYFVHHGWKTGEPVAVEAVAVADYQSALLNQLEPPTVTLAQHSKDGLSPVARHAQTLPAMPLRLEGEEGDEYWLGFNNFYTITRYNHSHRYAMAVYQLSQLIRERVGA
jgi:membrane-bound lytic murein transglycosylase B